MKSEPVYVTIRIGVKVKKYILWFVNFSILYIVKQGKYKPNLFIFAAIAALHRL